jgi:4-carboxymuconolactone decarboxylase
MNFRHQCCESYTIQLGGAALYNRRIEHRLIDVYFEGDSGMQNKQLYDLGKRIRREVVGGEYDDVIQNSESDFSQPIRDWTTENVWGTVWADETLSRKTRSLLNVALTVALRCPHEMKVHMRGARNNGCTKEEIRAVLMQVTVYGGVLAVREAVRQANALFVEEEQNKR